MSGLLGVIHLHPCSKGQSIQRMLPFISLHADDEDITSTFIDQGMELGYSGKQSGYLSSKNTIVYFSGDINLEQTETHYSYDQDLKNKSQVTAALLKAYRLHGPDFVKGLHGSYTILIYHRAEKKLLLFRDPLGQTQLYWYKTSKNFVFASSLKALLASGLIPQTPSMKGVGAFLQLGFVPQNLSLIKNVHTLPPGHYLEYQIDDYLTVSPINHISATHHSKDKTPSLMKAFKQLPESISHICSINQAFGEEYCDRLYPKPLTKIPPPRYRIKEILNTLPNYIWLLESPLSDVHLPYILDKQLAFCKENQVNAPILAIGQNSLFLPTEISQSGFSFAFASGKLSGKLKHLLNGFLGIKTIPIKVELPWMDDFLEELEMPPNIENISKEPFHAFSPHLYLKSEAFKLPLQTIRSFIFSFYNFMRLPSVELPILQAFSKLHHTRSICPFLNPTFYNDISSIIAPYPPNNNELNIEDLTPEEIECISNHVNMLKNGKLAELGLFNSPYFDRIFITESSSFSSMHYLWPFLTLEMWMQTFIDTSPKTTPPIIPEITSE